MIKAKLHNPVIAKDSHIENAVMQKVTSSAEAVFSDLGNATPVVPEIGRVWFNTENGVFRFANINGGTNYVDEFLSRTDLRAQTVASKVTIKDTFKVNNTSGGTIFTVDATSKNVTIAGASYSSTLSGNSSETITGNNTVGITGTSSTTINGAVTETYQSTKNENVSNNSYLTIGGLFNTTVTGNVTETYQAAKSEGVTTNYTLTVGGTSSTTVSGAVTTNVTGNVTETFSANQTTNVTGAVGLKVGQTLTLTDGSNNVKFRANNTANSLTTNYTTVDVNGQTETHKMSNKFVINDGSTDKYVIDNTNNKVTIVYATLESTNTDVVIDASNSFKLKDSGVEKIFADHANNALNITYDEVNITGNATVDGNMLITGDLTVGGQTTKVDIASEQLTIADNIIVLNANLTDEDPRLASAIVSGGDVDADAGISVNRGSQGILPMIRWVESDDTSSAETLKQAVAKVSIWNYEAGQPAYQLYQIIDAYTAARQTANKSGTSWIGYDGQKGTHYNDAIAAGATSSEALEYSFKIDADSLDDVIDSIVQEIDELKFNNKNTVRVGETPSAGKSFTITHNLGTVFVDVRIQRQDDTEWLFDVLPTKVVDSNTVMIESTETTKIRYMITAIEGFDVNQATELVIA